MYLMTIKSLIFQEWCQVGRIQVIAFQSSDGKQNYMSRAVPVSPAIDVELSASSSENVSARSGSPWLESLEQDTADSRATSGAFKVSIFLSTLFILELLAFLLYICHVVVMWSILLYAFVNLNSPVPWFWIHVTVLWAILME